MAAYENVREVSVVVGVDNTGAAAVTKYRFAKWKNAGADREVTAATGVADPVAGVLSQKVPTNLQPGQAYVSPAVSMVVPDAGIALVELGEAVTDITVGLRPGTLGKAFLCDAAGDSCIGYPLELGSIGQIIGFQFRSAPALHA